MRDHLLDLFLFLLAALALFVIVGLFASAMNRDYQDRSTQRAVERSVR